MPRYILKPDPAEDFYVYWSTVVESPIGWGDRKTMEAEWPNEMATERFERADATGSSSMDRFFEWGDNWIYEQKGFVGHAQLKTMCERKERMEPVLDLVRPL